MDLFHLFFSQKAPPFADAVAIHPQGEGGEGEGHRLVVVVGALAEEEEGLSGVAEVVEGAEEAGVEVEVEVGMHDRFA